MTASRGGSSHIEHHGGEAGHEFVRPGNFHARSPADRPGPGRCVIEDRMLTASGLRACR